MTKYTIFKLVSILFLVAGLVAVCVVEDRVALTSLNKVSDYCYEIESAVQKNGTIVSGEVTALVDNMEDYWEKQESQLCFMVNHKSIEPLGVEIVRLKAYIDEDEPIEFLVSLDLIKHYCQTFQHFMGANFHNIL